MSDENVTLDVGGDGAAVVHQGPVAPTPAATREERRADKQAIAGRSAVDVAAQQYAEANGANPNDWRGGGVERGFANNFMLGTEDTVERAARETQQPGDAPATNPLKTLALDNPALHAAYFDQHNPAHKEAVQRVARMFTGDTGPSNVTDKSAEAVQRFAEQGHAIDSDGTQLIDVGGEAVGNSPQEIQVAVNGLRKTGLPMALANDAEIERQAEDAGATVDEYSSFVVTEAAKLASSVGMDQTTASTLSQIWASGASEDAAGADAMVERLSSELGQGELQRRLDALTRLTKQQPRLRTVLEQDLNWDTNPAAIQAVVNWAGSLR